MKRIMALLAGAAALTAACNPESGAAPITGSTTASSPLSVSRSFEQMVGATATSTVTGCDNSPGPYITIEGGLRLGGLGTRMTFSNNVKGTHTYTDDAHVDLTVVPADGNNITIPKQPVLGGVGGNPFIWIQLEDGNGHAVTDEVYLGRCVQGLVPPGHDVRFAKQPSQGGVGGNPWIFFNFLSDAGASLNDPALLGRCEQLSKS